MKLADIAGEKVRVLNCTGDRIAMPIHRLLSVRTRVRIHQVGKSYAVGYALDYTRSVEYTENYTSKVRHTNIDGFVGAFSLDASNWMDAQEKITSSIAQTTDLRFIQHLLHTRMKYPFF